jgi:hypothetical protein
MFFSLSEENPNKVYAKLAECCDHRIQINNKTFVGWNERLINEGKYDYAFSHIPFHRISISEKTFTFTCFRDPVKRIVSHYNMLLEFAKNKIQHPCMDIEGKWIGHNFDDFLSNVPRNHLLNQLYMFSPDLDIKEGLSNVKKLSHFFFCEKFNNGVNELNQKLGLNMKPMHVRKSRNHAPITNENLIALKEILKDEYKFLSMITDLKVD